ncbi:acyl-CoA dehydrogenase family protein [Anaerotignum sp. MSJ-24]|uniref:acyl-CoA dehydrogenase family protein n=1 Tax=Anaerotignum sp. MSJ-24 TaxID=2841521 RepID=UPI001C113596|nr:acyl-CoA dehydrogenase family protein [Anaerotignum sp. MSJ-24]MBU5464773.1 acyl-CoA dehydrogenase family protein [Anaerotignum sp. MSJ-24]
MDFEFNENQLDLQKMVRELAEKEIGPRAKENDEKDVFPVDVFKMMADMGLTAIGVPESYGGPEATDIERMIAIEEIAKKDGAVATILAVHGMFVQALEKYGTEEQKKRFYPRIAEEGYYTAFALTEPCAGSDPASAKTTAVYDPATDEYVLNGNKCFITGGARADAILVFALTDPSLGAKGMSAFIVEKGMKGFSTGKIEDKMGIRCSETAELFFDDCRVPKANLVGQEGKGFGIAMNSLDGARIGVGAIALGLAEGALDESLSYIEQRVQFGKPISKLQGIQWYIADMATEIETAKWMVYHAAYLRTVGKPYTKEASMCKLHNSKVAREVTNLAMQIHGGYGYMKEYPVERMYRDAKITEIYEGTSEIQKVIIAKQVMTAAKK